VPIVAFDQLYSFDRESLIDAIPSPGGVAKKEAERFRATAAERLDRVLQLADNAGATDEHRAVNYLAVRYPAIYRRPENTSQRLRLAARSLQAPHGRIPDRDVARLITSPRPTSVSALNPGMLTRWVAATSRSTAFGSSWFMMLS
jgi:hypothetical protein